MSISIPNFLTPKVVSSLDTYDYTIQTDGDHVCSAQMTMAVQPSSLSVLIKKNSSTIYTSAAPSAAQSILNCSVSGNFVAGDVIHFVISSADQADAAPNVIKGILNIHRGDSN